MASVDYSDAQITVSPQALQQVSGEFSQTGSEIKGLTDEMLQLVQSTVNSFQGNEADAYRNRFKQLEDDMGRIHKMITEHSKDLEDIATETKTTQANIGSIIDALAENVIE